MQADNSDICSSCSCINIGGCSGTQYNPTKVKDRKKNNQLNSMFRQHCNGSAKSTAYLDPKGKLSKNK